MAFSVEEDEAADPIEVGLFGANAVMLDAQVPADAVEQLGRRLRKRKLSWGWDKSQLRAAPGNAAIIAVRRAYGNPDFWCKQRVQKRVRAKYWHIFAQLQHGPDFQLRKGPTKITQDVAGQERLLGCAVLEDG